jgi:hypothetical protein
LNRNDASCEAFPVLDRYLVPASALRVTSSQGQVILWPVTHAITMAVAIGHGDAALGEQLRDANQQLMEGRHGVTSFFDAVAFTGYESRFRTTLADLGKRQIKSGQLAASCVLTRSKIVSMGAAVANLVLDSRLRVFADACAFDEHLVNLGGGAALRAVGVRETG